MQVRATSGSLAQQGVELLQRTTVSRMRCEDCGTVWEEQSAMDERSVGGWWKCPTGCNGWRKSAARIIQRLRLVA